MQSNAAKIAQSMSVFWEIELSPDLDACAVKALAAFERGDSEKAIIGQLANMQVAVCGRVSHEANAKIAGLLKQVISQHA
jgi:hypothetical protein